MEKRPLYSKLPVQPGERFLALIGWDYWNTESAARQVAEAAEKKILELEQELQETLEEEGHRCRVESCLPELKD